LAIGRALLFNPRLLLMDEPTEGLAPVIVDQVAAMLKTLAREGGLGVLLIEQNLGVAIEVADTVAVLVNGRVARVMPAAELEADRALQQRLLGVQSGNGAGHEARASAASPLESGPATTGPVEVLPVRRASGEAGPSLEAPTLPAGLNRWNAATPLREVSAAAAEDVRSASPGTWRGESVATGRSDTLAAAGPADALARGARIY